MGALLENPAALKSKGVKAALSDIVVAVAVKCAPLISAPHLCAGVLTQWLCHRRHGQLVTVTTALLHLLNKHEHLPGPVAELAEAAVKRHGDSRLAVALLREVGAVEPAEYKRQTAADAVGVRCVGALLVELAERLPLTVGKNIALLRPHLDGEAHGLRSALLGVLGHLIVGFSDPNADAAGSSATSAEALPAAAQLRVHAKEGFLEALAGRTHDSHAFTRARVLTTWSFLAERRALPLSHYGPAAASAAARLADTKAVVRKAAAVLLRTLLQHNPYAAQLGGAALKATLADWQARLDASAQRDDAEKADAAASAAAQVEAAEARAAGTTPLKAPPTPGEQPPPPTPAPQSEAAALAAEEAAANSEAEARLDGGTEALRMMVAALSGAVAFSATLAGAVGPACAMLGSATSSDATEAAALLVACRQFGVDGAGEGVRKVLALVFAREPAVRSAALEAADTLYLAQEPAGAADALLELVTGAALGELVAAEEVLTQLVKTERLAPGGPVMRHLWAEAAGRGAALTAEDAAALTPAALLARRTAALDVLCMAGSAAPAALRAHVPLLLGCLTAGARGHAPLARAACVALGRAGAHDPDAPASLGPGPAPWAADHAAFDAVAALMSARAAGALDGAAWFPTAEAALAALYVLHPAPEAAAAQMLARMAMEAGLVAGPAAAVSPAEGDETEAAAPVATLGAVNAQALSRFLFALGTVALRQLVHVEASARAVRAARLKAEKAAVAAAEAAAAAPPKPAPKAAKKSAKGAAAAPPAEDVDADPGSLAAQLGQGVVSADAELDALREAAEAELVSAHSGGIVALFAPLAAAVASRPELLAAHPLLRAAALSALCRLCACDAAFCEAHLALLFTRLKDTPAPGTRASLLVALGDLAFRFPNAVEPWTAHFYGLREWGSSLHDAHAGVRKHALTVLSHLVLNDMMKVKGHIADMALCLEDAEPSIASLARLFFFELSHRTGAPIYNLLPDVLSRLSADAALPADGFQRILKHLLSFVDKDKQADALAEKLVARMAEAAPKQARDVSYCLSQLSLSERGLKKLADGFKMLEPALADATVFAHLEAAVRGAKKGSGAAANKPELKAAAEELEARLRAVHEERAEIARAAERAARHEGKASGEAGEDEGASAGAGSPQKENAQPPPAPAPAAPKGRGKGAKAAAPKAAAGGKKAPAKARVKKAVASSDDDDDDAAGDSDGGAPAPKPRARQPLRARAARAAPIGGDDSD
jgi:condensin complex subunit 1